MDYLLTQYQLFMEISKSNPIVASIIAIAGMGAVTFMLRAVPAKIFAAIKTQVTSTLVFNNAGWGGNEEQFLAFMTWYTQQSWARLSRRYSLESTYAGQGEYNVHLGAGFGTHFMLYRNRLFWFTKSKLESQGSSVEKFEINITGLTRDDKIMQALIEDFRYRANTKEIKVRAWNWDKWTEPRAIAKRDLDTVIISHELKARLTRECEQFINGREWHESRGLPYKLTVLLYGPPGTGKTSLIKALASHYRRNVYTVNLNGVTDNTLMQAMLEVPAGSVVLFEDFATNRSVAARKNLIVGAKPKAVEGVAGAPTPAAPALTAGAEMMMEGSLSLSGLLNALDGIVSIDGNMVFLTTNTLSNIDPALLRAGRVDLQLEVPYLTDTEIKDYIRLMAPEYNLAHGLLFEDIAGCDLMALFRDNRSDMAAFIAAIPTVPTNFLRQA